MRLCLAHFGDNKEWDDYLSRNRNINLSLEQMDWVSQIVTMMKSGQYPNLYADISCFYHVQVPRLCKTTFVATS
jgi:hypothetical protein